MGRPRRSSATILTRGRGEALEVYLVRRADELRFFGGYWAFPGGVADAVDRRPEDGDDPEPAQARAAVRELFEETGVWLGDPASWRTGERDAARAGLLAAEPELGPWAARADAVDDAAAGLRRVCELTTPPFAPIRHRTPFFHAELPPDEQPRVVRGELEEGAFARPAEVIASWTRGERLVVPPALWLLRRLDEGLSHFFERAASDAARLAADELHEVTFSPGMFVAALETDTLPPATTTNTVLIGHERVHVVDPATRNPSELARLFRTMDVWVADGRRFESVLLARHHSDHVGGVRRTAERYALPVLAHEETLARIDVSGLDTRPLVDGEALDLGVAPDGTPGWTLHVLHTPGHAPGHLVFQEDRYGAAAVGDMASTLSTIVIDPPDGHMATYLASLERLRARGIGMLHPAHGPAHRDGTELLGELIRHRHERERRLMNALGPAVRSEDDLLAEVYDDVADERLLPVAARSMRAGLEKLEEEGRARRAASGWTGA